MPNGTFVAQKNAYAWILLIDVTPWALGVSISKFCAHATRVLALRSTPYLIEHRLLQKVVRAKQTRSSDFVGWDTKVLSQSLMLHLFVNESVEKFALWGY